MHVHVGVVEFAIFLAYYVIAKFLIRQLQQFLVERDSPFGAALAYLD